VTVNHMVTPVKENPVRARSGSKQHTRTEAPNFAPMVQAQGKKLMAPSACVDFHPFAKTLKEWEMGVPVDCGKELTWETIEAAVEKGHTSLQQHPSPSS
jgi:hypothetical protein